MLVTITALISLRVFADIVFNSSPPPDTKLPTAADFATEVLNNPWDMDSKADLPNYVTVADSSGFTTPTFNGGILDMTMTSSSGYFYMLSPGFCGTNLIGNIGYNNRIDTNKYRYLKIRMHTDTPSKLRVLVNNSCNYFNDYWRSVGINTQSGWHTYTIDMQTIAHESAMNSDLAWNAAPATGLRIDPTEVVGANVKIDYIMLTAAAPADNIVPDYSSTPIPNQYLSFFVDDNTDPLDGAVKNVVFAGSGSPRVSTTSDGLSPGTYRITSIESNDYASLFGNTWDMSDSGDLRDIIGINGGFSGGLFYGTTTTAGSYFFLNTPSDYPIDSTKFRYMTISTSVSVSGSGLLRFFDTSGNPIGSPNFFPIAPTQSIYEFDLYSLSGWSGNIGKIQMSLNSNSGANVFLDYISLKSYGYGAPSVNSTNSTPWEFKVNSPPLIKILQPDVKGGEDFAQAVLGNPWNMDTTSDIYSTSNVTDARILPNNYINGVQGNFYGAKSVAGSFDPTQDSHATFDPVKMINASRYKNLNYRLFIDRTQDIVEGSVIRFIWHESSSPGSSFFNGDDEISFDGWNEYPMDLSKVILEPLNHPPGSYPNPAWYGLVNIMRVDAHEFSVPTDFYFDYIRVAADDESNSKYAITWEGSDADNDNASISFYYSSSDSTSGGSLIGSATLDDSTRVLYWDTSAIPDGTYYVYAVINDGDNTNVQKATGRIVISHSRAQDTAAPILNVDGPVNNQTVYDTFVTKGFALDDIQLATLEALIDGDLYKNIQPSLFNSTAQQAYRQFAESNNPGFFETLNVGLLSPGLHNFQLRAIDTAGNITLSAVIPINKVGGQDPNPESPPAPVNEAAISIGGTSNPTPTSPPGPTSPNGTPPLGVTAKLNVKMKQLDITATNTAGCSSFRALAASTLAELNTKPTLIKAFPFNTGNTKKLSAKKIRGLAGKGAKAKIFFRIDCYGDGLSRSVTLSPAKIAGAKSKNQKAWINHLKKKLK